MRDAFLAVLGALALTWPSTIQEVAGTPIATRHCPKECITFLTRPIPQSKLQKYEKSTCGKAAVILTTKKNLVFCANPKDNWVQLAMHLLDEKNAPPSPTVDKSISEKRVMLHGTAIPTIAQVGDTTGPTETVGPAHYGTTFFSFMRMGMSSMPTGSSAGSTPQPEVDTHQPEILVNGNMISSITDGPKTLVEDLMPVGKGLEELTGSLANDLGAHPAVPKTPITSTSYNQFDSEDPMGSPIQSTSHPSSIFLIAPLTDSGRSGTKSTTISPDLLTPSSRKGSILSSPRTGSGPNSTMGPTTRNFTGQSSTPFGSDGSKISSVNISDKRGVVNHSTTAFGGASETPSLMEANRYLFPESSGTLPNSHQESVIEKSQAAEATSQMPEVLVTTILSSYRTHFITLAALGGILCIATVAWAFAKLGICTTSSPTEMVQGLLISPSKFQTNACAVDIL
ncbi:hypothetical protein lerEdw1_001071 [Lerista edwardsae]|nr:hypothetical protein lerEdw1_001071 [Lerista edwardsae]